MGKGNLFDELKKSASDFIAHESNRHDARGWWKPPLVATAPVDDRFDALPRIAANDHLHPNDLLESAKSVVVFYIPFKKDLVSENRKGDRPCRSWGLAYVDTNDLIGRLSRELSRYLEGRGFSCGLTPATHNFDEEKLMARWSHKHLAHLVGLGRFGVNHLLITPAGCTGRLGSLVTDAELGIHPSIDTEEACLLKAGHACGRCIEACPVNALSPAGFNRRACWNRLLENRETLAYFSDLPPSTHVCGKCAAGLPCSFKNPVAARRIEKSDLPSPPTGSRRGLPDKRT